MADSTEELTPVLIPFEKSIEPFKKMYDPVEQETIEELSQKGQAEAMAAAKNEPHRRDLAKKAMMSGLKGKNPLPEKTPIIIDNNPLPAAEAPAGHTATDAEAPAGHTATDTEPSTHTPAAATATATASNAAQTASAPAVKPKKEKKPHKGWRDSDADHGLSVMSNIAGNITSGLATAGDATRKMVQGILNPGVMGQGAAGGMLEAADTMITPSKQSKEALANLENASIFSMEHEEMKNAVRAYQEKEAMRAKMNEQAAELFKTTPWHQMYTQRLTPEQYEQFASTWNNNLDALVALWKRDGAPPDLIDDVYKAYSSPLDIAKKNYEQGIRTSKAAETYDRAENEAENAESKAAAVNTAMARTRKNFDDVSKLDNMGWVNVYKNWALQNGLARLDQGEIVLNDRDLFTDQFGNTIDSPNFDSATVKVNYAAKGSTLNNFIDFLENSSIENNQKWAAYLRAGRTKYDEIEGARKKAASDAAFYEMQAKEQAPIRYSDNTGNAAMNDAAADAIKGFGTRFIQLYGKELGLTAQQLDSLAKNGGLASTSIDDYEALSKLHGILTKRQTQILPIIKAASEKTAMQTEKMKNGEPGATAPALTEAELEAYREELIYENLSYRLAAMDRIKELDKSAISFSRRLDQNGHEYVDERGFPVHVSQMDALHRLRTEAHINLNKALTALNDDLLESTIATFDPQTSEAGGQIYDASKHRWGYITFSDDPTDLAKNQAHHLYLMVKTDHNQDTLGGLSDSEVAGRPTNGTETDFGISGPNRRVHYRYSDFMNWVNEAAYLLGGTKMGPDNDFPRTTMSEEGKIGSAAATQIMQTIDNLTGMQDGSVAAIVRGLKTRRGNNNLFIDPNAIIRYGYGEFVIRPPSADDMDNIRFLIQSIDGLWNSTDQKTGRSIYTDDEKNAMKQYRAAVTVNSTEACLKRDLANGQNSRAIIDAYKNYTRRTNISDATAMKELKAILKSDEFGELKTNLRLIKEGDNDTYITELMGDDRENYIGTIPQKRVKTINLTKPKNTLGLMNYIYASIYSPPPA